MMSNMRSPKNLALMTNTVKPVIKKIIDYKSKNPSKDRTCIHPPKRKVCFNQEKYISTKLGGYIFFLIETNLTLWRMDASSVFTWIFAFVVYDFFYYWFHRISHERQIFWASHVAHHQSEDYNLSTALRQTGTCPRLS